MKKYVLIVNPKAGMNKHRLTAADILPAFSAPDVEIIEKTTLRGGHATEITMEYAGKCDAIIVSGGDGTYNEVLNGMIKSGQKTPVVYLPCGSTNDFANTLKLPMKPADAAELLRKGSMHEYDVGQIGDTQFSYVASFGIGTSVSYSTSQKAKNIFGHLAYIVNGFVLNFFPIMTNLKPTHLRFETAEGDVYEDDYFLVFVANTVSVSGIFDLKPFGVKLNDGLFEVMLVRGLTPSNIIPALMRILKKDYSGDNIVIFKTAGLKVIADHPLNWAIDGECFDCGETCEIKVLPKAVTLVSEKTELI